MGHGIAACATVNTSPVDAGQGGGGGGGDIYCQGSNKHVEQFRLTNWGTRVQFKGTHIHKVFITTRLVARTQKLC